MYVSSAHADDESDDEDESDELPREILTPDLYKIIWNAIIFFVGKFIIFGRIFDQTS